MGINAVTGFLLGSFHHYLYNHSTETFDWTLENLLLLIIFWAFVNFVVGMILIRKARPVVAGPSAIVEIGTRRNIFMILLSVSLILDAILNTLVKFESYDALYIVWPLYSISAILVSVFYLLKKDIPRNFGFITLAIFSLFNAIILAILAFNSESPWGYFLLVNGIIALASGVFFISQKETWINPGFLMLSAYLILAGVAGSSLILYDVSAGTNLWFISSFFAVPAAIFFLLRK
jgi:hypothetical protein